MGSIQLENDTGLVYVNPVEIVAIEAWWEGARKDMCRIVLRSGVCLTVTDSVEEVMVTINEWVEENLCEDFEALHDADFWEDSNGDSPVCQD